METPRERKIGLSNREFETDPGLSYIETYPGEPLLVRVIGKLEKPRFREIGIPPDFCGHFTPHAESRVEKYC